MKLFKCCFRFSLVAIVMVTTIFSVPAFATSMEKYISGRIVKRITSKTRQLDNRQLIKANEQDGYRIEIERFIGGYAGPLNDLTKIEKKFDVKLGINFTAGVVAIGGRDVANHEELTQYIQKDPTDYLQADKLETMVTGETFQYLFEGGMIIDPEISAFGIWGVVVGGWQVKIEKKSVNEIEVEVYLVDSQIASFYFDKFSTMISYDVGRRMEEGFQFAMNFHDLEVKKAYNKFFRGDISFAQKLSKENSNIKINKKTKRRILFFGTGIWSRSPFIAWFLLNANRYTIKTELEDFNVVKNQTDQTLTMSFKDDCSLDFLGSYSSKIRLAQITSSNIDKKIYANDIWLNETTRHNKLPQLLQAAIRDTLLIEYFDFNIPKDVDYDYASVSMKIEYSEKLIEHIKTKNVDTDFLKVTAMNNLNEVFKSKLRRDSPEHIPGYTLAKKRIYRSIEAINEAQNEMFASCSDEANEECFKSYVNMMKKIYKSPELYKAWVEYAKRCGMNLSITIGSSNLSGYRVDEKYPINELCRVE